MPDTRKDQEVLQTQRDRGFEVYFGLEEAKQAARPFSRKCRVPF